MTGKELTDFLESVYPQVSEITRRKIREVLSLAYEYRYLGARFTFDKSRELDTEVNRILLEMSDSVLDYINNKVNTIDSDDKEDILAYIARPQSGQTLTERVDSYSSHTKYLLEGFIAIAFYYGWSLGSAETQVSIFLKSPYTYTHIKDAFHKISEFDAGIIKARGYHFGSGVTTDPTKGLGLTAQVAANEAMQMSELRKYIRNPRVIGYRVHRGSGYDCAHCDELCVGIHPLDDLVLPAHPHCCCYMTPVYEGEA